jgi:hypothetical protein
MQRIDSGNHWPSDVYAGVLPGALISRTLLARRDLRRAREEGAGAAAPDVRERDAAAPAAGPDGARVRIVPTFGRGQGLGARVHVTF